MTHNSERTAFQQLILALGDFLEATPENTDSDETGGVIHIDYKSTEDFLCVTRGDAERLTEILRAATPKQRNQTLDNILKSPRPELWSLDHTRAGALDSDKKHVSTMIERANRELSPLLLERFTIHLDKEIGTLADAYHSAEDARIVLQEHADQEMKRIRL